MWYGGRSYRPFGEEQIITETLSEQRLPVYGKGEGSGGRGLHYFGARYMESQIGRFISPDPLGAWMLSDRQNSSNGYS